MSNKDTDPPASKTPGVWPPPPSASPHTAEPDGKKDTQFSTLTPYAWLDLVLGLPAGSLGALLVSAAVGILGDLVSPPPETAAEVRFEWWASAALSAAACVFLVRRAPLFGIALTTGALIVLLIDAALAWLLSVMPNQ